MSDKVFCRLRRRASLAKHLWLTKQILFSLQSVVGDLRLLHFLCSFFFISLFLRNNTPPPVCKRNPPHPCLGAVLFRTQKIVFCNLCFSPGSGCTTRINWHPVAAVPLPGSPLRSPGAARDRNPSASSSSADTYTHVEGAGNGAGTGTSR